MADSALADPQLLAEAVGRSMYRRDRASQMLGMALEAIAPGRAQMSMRVRPDMCNGHGICHGGLIFTLADSVFAYASNSYNINAVALGCTIDFMTTGKDGDMLTAVGEMRQQGARTGLYDITLTNQDGQTVALFRGKSYRIKGAVLSELPA